MRKAGPDHVPAWELYDLAADLRETNDLAAKYPEVVKRLESVFKSQWTPNTEYPMYPPKKKGKQ
jgi:hypothetical protein